MKISLRGQRRCSIAACVACSCKVTPTRTIPVTPQSPPPSSAPAPRDAWGRSPVSALAALAAWLLLTVPGAELAQRGKTSELWHAAAQSCACGGERRP